MQNHLPEKNEGKLTEKITNIYTYPNNITAHPSGSVVTLGDLHGNAAKYWNLLVSEGIIAKDESDPQNKEFKQFIEIYKKSNKLTKKEYAQFLELLNNIKISPNAPKLRLIGDDLADRGNNDLLTLHLFQKLNELGVEVEIVGSNHGMEFLKQFAYGLNGKQHAMLYKERDWTNSKSFGESYFGLRNSIQDKIVSEKNVNAMIEAQYLPNLKLLSYNLDNNNQITIYSHAPINDYKIKSLIDFFNDAKINNLISPSLPKIAFKNGSAHELAETIDHINNSFKLIFQNKANLLKFFSLIEQESNLYFEDKKKLDRTDAPKQREIIQEKFKNNLFYIFDNLVNDRYDAIYNNLKDINSNYSYSIINVHGHVGEDKLKKINSQSKWGYINLDTDSGKFEENNENDYVYYSYEKQENKPEKKFIYNYNNIEKNESKTISMPNSSILQNELKNDLEKYITRIEKHKIKNTKKINFAHQFWIFSDSRAANRKINYQTAIQLRNKLNEPNPDINEIFKDIKKSGSSELNKIIEKAQKNAEKPTQHSPIIKLK